MWWRGSRGKGSEAASDGYLAYSGGGFFTCWWPSGTINVRRGCAAALASCSRGEVLFALAGICFNKHNTALMSQMDVASRRRNNQCLVGSWDHRLEESFSLTLKTADNNDGTLQTSFFFLCIWSRSAEGIKQQYRGSVLARESEGRRKLTGYVFSCTLRWADLL